MGFTTGSNASASGSSGLRAVTEPRAADDDDERVVATISRREQDGLAQAYAAHSHAVYDFARCIVHDTALAEDVVQDVFVRLWNRPERFDAGRGTLRTYLLTLAHGRSIDLIRSESARRRREEREAHLNPDRDPHDRMDEQLASNEVVHAALGQLQPSEREAIALAYFGDHTYREVATILETPEGTIKNRIRSGLAHLRVALGTELDDEAVTS